MRWANKKSRRKNNPTILASHVRLLSLCEGSRRSEMVWAKRGTVTRKRYCTPTVAKKVPERPFFLR